MLASSVLSQSVGQEDNASEILYVVIFVNIPPAFGLDDSIATRERLANPSRRVAFSSEQHKREPTAPIVYHLQNSPISPEPQET